MRPRKKYGTKNSIGKNIIALREKRHMKQGELLAQLQLHNIPISASSLSDLEGQNRHVSEREIIALMDIFQITFEELCSNSFYSKDIPIGRNIQAIRIEKKLTQEQVVAKLQLMGSNMSRSTLANIEVGRRNIKASDLRALKTLFDVDYDMFFKI